MNLTGSLDTDAMRVKGTTSSLGAQPHTPDWEPPEALHAKKRGDGGPQEQLSSFFKAPMVKNGHGPEHDFGKQQTMLLDWLGAH